MENQLPSEFDLIIVGTGLIESIISAAASRIGKSVLHIDSNDYYGGQWASFNLKALNNFTQKETVEANENFLIIGNSIFNIRDFHSKWHIPEKSKIHIENVEKSLEALEIRSDDANANENTEEVQQEENITKEPVPESSVEYSQESLLKESRRFNIDLLPKIHYARGDFVELLISSNIARYAEYRSVSRILTSLNGQLELVPCSRSDVFANNKVSVIEKRMLMKLFTSLHENSDEIKDQENKSFKQFLKDRKLTPNIIHYVLYAISRSTDNTPCAEGIEQTKRFLNSLGRFGKTPFLFSMYGSGETTQAFCRLSAVFGGVFALSQETLSGIQVEDNKVKVVVNGAQKIAAEHFVFGAEKSPKEFVKSLHIKDYISRAIIITDRSIMPSEQEHLTLLMYPPENGKPVVTVIEMGSATGTCPKGLCLVHLTSKQVTGPQEDFQHIIQNLFETDAVELTQKPRILWSCYFSIPDSSNLSLNENVPSNLFLCSGPDLDLDYDLSIQKARCIFEKMYPGLDFLPRAPDPEEIIIGGESDQTTEELSGDEQVQEEMVENQPEE